VVEVALKEFLFTGRFGPVELGMKRQDVLTCLGVADCTGGTSRKHRIPAIWKYGSFEFHFGDAGQPLTLIHADDFEGLTGGARVALEPWCLSGRLARDAAERAFQAARLTYFLRPDPSGDAGDQLLTEGGVALLFRGNPREAPYERRLVAISRSRWGP